MLGKIRKLDLDNGMRALLVERHSLPVVASMISYSVGSRDERTDETGLSHFLEHMMFKGTSRYAKGEIDQITGKLGGSNNAFTDHDWTGYYFSLASDRWEQALDIEANRMTDCLFDPREFEAEKSVVLEELAMGEDDPWKMLWQAAESLVFDHHGYRRPVIGYRQDLERVTPDAMRDYYGRHYAPNRASLVVVGDFDPSRTEERIRELFGGIERGAEREVGLDETGPRLERRGVIRAPGELTRIAMCTRTCRIGERDDFLLDILSQVLGGGRSSRLYRRLVLDDELATHVVTYNETRAEPGLFWIAAELRPGADPARVEAVVREELERLVQDGVDAGELKRARVQVRSSFLFEEETCLDTAQKIARFECLTARGHRLLRDILPTLDSIQRRELRDAAARYFADDSWAVVWSLPESASARRPKQARRKKKATKKKVAAKKVTAKKAAAKKGATKKVSAKKSTAKKSSPKKAAAKKSAPKESGAQSSAAKAGTVKAGTAKKVGTSPKGATKKSGAKSTAPKKAPDGDGGSR